MCILFGIALQGCTGAGYDSSLGTVANSIEKNSAIDAVNVALSKMDCGSALSSIIPLYQSSNTDNPIRFAAASSYGCSARIKLFTVLDHLISFPGNLAGSGFWEFLVQEFPSSSSPDDKIPQSAMNGTDALQAILIPGTVLVESASVNTSTDNPGSLLYTDRISDANSYLTFMSMALMGSLLYRNGLPSANYHKSQDLPWTTADLTQGDGCALAAATLNFYDGISYVKSVASPNVAGLYQKISDFLATGLDAACQTGCAICGGSVTCTTCPSALRSRASCTGATTDINSCAAAGIVTFINGSWDGPP